MPLARLYPVVFCGTVAGREKWFWKIEEVDERESRQVAGGVEAERADAIREARRALQRITSRTLA